MELRQLWRVRVECVVLLFLLAVWLISVLDEAVAFMESPGGPLAMYEAAVEADPSNPQAQFDLARARHQSNDLQGAIESYEQVLRLDPERFDAYVCLASCYRQLNRSDEAKQTWQRAFEREPDRAWKFLYLVRADYGLGEDEQVVADWQRAIELRPDVAWPYMFLGRACEKLQRQDEARTWYEKAQHVDPNVADWFWRQAEELCGQRKWHNAVEFYTLGLKARPDDPQAHLALGKLHLQLDNQAAALEEYRALRQVDGKLAKDLLQGIREKYADCLEVHLHLGRIHLEQQDYQEAAAAFRDAIRISPDRADLHVSLGEALYHLGAYDEAVKSYDNAIRLEPEAVRTHVLMAKAYVGSGSEGMAIEYLRRALELDRDEPQVHYELGRFYLHMGNEDMATEECRKLQKLDAKLADELRVEIGRAERRPVQAEKGEGQLEALGRLLTIGFGTDGGNVAYFERLSTPVRTGQIVYGFKARVLSNEVRFTKDGMEWVRKLSSQ